MTAVRLETFGGMAPKISNRLLPDTAASNAKNARLLSGELRGIRTPSRIHRFTSGTVKNVKRIFKDNGVPVWLGLADADSDIVKGPLVNDSFNRHYWSGQEAYIAYNDLDRIENGDTPYRLGTPSPVAAPVLTVVGGTEESETRAYVYTFVNFYSEESKPSPVVSASGPFDGSWDLSVLETSAPDMANRQAITKKRIYRTITGQSTVSYYQVAEIDLVDATYSDTTINSQTVLNPLLNTWQWGLPSDDLKGLVVHPAGFLAAFDGRDVHFSERYRPHAWAVANILAVEHKIVGLAVYNNMIAVMTTGQPYFLQGSRPSGITPTKLPAAEPCLSKGSIASTIAGVLYASPNGLVLFNERGPNVITQPIISIEEWEAYSPTTMRGAQFGQQYLGYYTDSKAIKFSPSEPFGVFVEIDKFENVDNVLVDQDTGDTWLMRNNDVFEWEPATGVPLYYEWTSKEFNFTRPVNFGAYMLEAEGETLEQQQADADLFSAYNTARFDADPPAALNPINFTPLNGKRTTNVDVGTTPEGIDEIQQNKYPIGGGPLYNLAAITSSITTTFLTVFANGDEILNEQINPGETRRMPSGFKAATWKFRLVGNSNIYSLAIAEVPKELQNV